MSARWVIDFDPGRRISDAIFDAGLMSLTRFFIVRGFFQGFSHRGDNGIFRDGAPEPPLELGGPLVEKHIQSGYDPAPGLCRGHGKGGLSGAVNYIHYGHFGLEKRIGDNLGLAVFSKSDRSALDDNIEVGAGFFEGIERNKITPELLGQVLASLHASIRNRDGSPGPFQSIDNGAGGASGAQAQGRFGHRFP